MTFPDLIEVAAKKAGSIKLLAQKVPISRQRLYSAAHDGPRLHIERMVRLSVIAGIDPLDGLRIGGRPELADLLRQSLIPGLKELQPQHQRLLLEFSSLPDAHQQAVFVFIAGLKNAPALYMY